jgi:DNA topoisomerase-1
VCRGERKDWWRRRGPKGRFWYADVDDRRIADPEEISRIHGLRIPPAWTNVRIAPLAGCKLQAVGIDTAGRIQYIYHPEFAARQQHAKYAKMVKFGDCLPRLRAITTADMRVPGLGKDKVLAVVVRLISLLYFRVGSERNVRRYRTFGVTTLRNHHLSVHPNGELTFSFVGKHHIRQRRVLVDARLAEIVSEIKAIGGSRLFQYLDDEGKAHPVTAADVNRYIRCAAGDCFSAKDMRTWGGSLHAALALAEMGAASSVTQARRNIVHAVKQVAECLGNTPAVCRSCYIHPVIFDRYMEGHTLAEYRKKAERYVRAHEAELYVEEVELLKLFRSHGSTGSSTASEE